MRGFQRSYLANVNLYIAKNKIMWAYHASDLTYLGSYIYALANCLYKIKLFQICHQKLCFNTLI